MESLVEFKKLGLSQETLMALKKKGFKKPTPIQEKVIPILMKEGKNVVGQAQTGTGKTAAFGIPIIEALSEQTSHVQAIILVPTRELALQVAAEIESLKGKKRLQVLPVYGGQSINVQLRKLQKRVNIVVGTPGRVLDHLRRKSLVLNKISFFVLDEADEMLNMGFIEDIERILQHTNQEKKMLLFSATIPKPILQIARKYMKNYEFIAVSTKTPTVNLTQQIYFDVFAEDKFSLLCKLIDTSDTFYGLVFCKTKLDTARIAARLIERGYGAIALHGDMTQRQRERAINHFKRHRANILVATDVAARGIDIHDLTHVINYALPQNPESYIHRIGRTGRAGKRGIAVTFVTPQERRKFAFIKKTVCASICKQKLPRQITSKGYKWGQW